NFLSLSPRQEISTGLCSNRNARREKKAGGLNLQGIFYHPLSCCRHYPTLPLFYCRYLLTLPVRFYLQKVSGKSSQKVLPASLPGHGSLAAFIISLTLRRCPSPRSWISPGEDIRLPR